MSEPKQSVGMDAFFTRERANDGIELPLYLPTGEKSEHWLRIRGIDSDVFREAEAEHKREAMRIAMLDDPKERAKAIADAKLSLLAALVIGWSFDQPCTPDEVKILFRQAPQLADAVDQAASRRAIFFAKRSSSSDEQQKPSSDST